MTLKYVLVLVALAACTKSFSFTGGSTSPSSSSGGGGGGGGLLGGSSGPAANTATSSPETWKKYDVRGVQLGQPRTALAASGFKCGKRANSRCYKIMDKRCDTGRCELEEDAFGQWFELNGAKTQLDYMSCATTETDSALVYDCRLKFGPRQVADADSTLGKALIAKYGPPSTVDEAPKEDKVGGGRMLWWNEKVGSNAPNIIVDCNSTTDEPQCTLYLNDGGLLDVERSKQTELDDKRKRQVARPTPQL
ncbi:MAG: hypothetical protein ABJE66_03035 [Deltaproteobacteria bacterium]